MMRGLKVQLELPRARLEGRVEEVSPIMRGLKGPFPHLEASPPSC